jgi:hypothetical protein
LPAFAKAQWQKSANSGHLSCPECLFREFLKGWRHDWYCEEKMVLVGGMCTDFGRRLQRIRDSSSIDAISR